MQNVVHDLRRLYCYSAYISDKPEYEKVAFNRVYWWNIEEWARELTQRESEHQRNELVTAISNDKWPRGRQTHSMCPIRVVMAQLSFYVHGMSLLRDAMKSIDHLQLLAKEEKTVDVNALKSAVQTCGVLVASDVMDCIENMKIRVPDVLVHTPSIYSLKHGLHKLANKEWFSACDIAPGEIPHYTFDIPLIDDDPINYDKAYKYAMDIIKGWGTNDQLMLCLKMYEASLLEDAYEHMADFVLSKRDSHHTKDAMYLAVYMKTMGKIIDFVGHLMTVIAALRVKFRVLDRQFPVGIQENMCTILETLHKKYTSVLDRIHERGR